MKKIMILLLIQLMFFNLIPKQSTYGLATGHVIKTEEFFKQSIKTAFPNMEDKLELIKDVLNTRKQLQIRVDLPLVKDLNHFNRRKKYIARKELLSIISELPADLLPEDSESLFEKLLQVLTQILNLDKNAYEHLGVKKIMPLIIEELHFFITLDLWRTLPDEEFPKKGLDYSRRIKDFFSNTNFKEDRFVDRMLDLNSTAAIFEIISIYLDLKKENLYLIDTKSLLKFALLGNDFMIRNKAFEGLQYNLFNIYLLDEYIRKDDIIEIFQQLIAENPLATSNTLIRKNTIKTINILLNFNVTELKLEIIRYLSFILFQKEELSEKNIFETEEILKILKRIQREAESLKIKEFAQTMIENFGNKKINFIILLEEFLKNELDKKLYIKLIQLTLKNKIITDTALLKKLEDLLMRNLAFIFQRPKLFEYKDERALDYIDSMPRFYHDSAAYEDIVLCIESIQIFKNTIIREQPDQIEILRVLLLTRLEKLDNPSSVELILNILENRIITDPDLLIKFKSLLMTRLDFLFRFPRDFYYRYDDTVLCIESIQRIFENNIIEKPSRIQTLKNLLSILLERLEDYQKIELILNILEHRYILDTDIIENLESLLMSSLDCLSKSTRSLDDGYDDTALCIKSIQRIFENNIIENPNQIQILKDLLSKLLKELEDRSRVKIELILNILEHRSILDTDILKNLDSLLENHLYHFSSNIRRLDNYDTMLSIESIQRILENNIIENPDQIQILKDLLLILLENLDDYSKIELILNILEYGCILDIDILKSLDSLLMSSLKKISKNPINLNLMNSSFFIRLIQRILGITDTVLQINLKSLLMENLEYLSENTRSLNSEDVIIFLKSIQRILDSKIITDKDIKEKVSEITAKLAFSPDDKISTVAILTINILPKDLDTRFVTMLIEKQKSLHELDLNTIAARAILKRFSDQNKILNDLTSISLAGILILKDLLVNAEYHQTQDLKKLLVFQTRITYLQLFKDAAIKAKSKYVRLTAIKGLFMLIKQHIIDTGLLAETEFEDITDFLLENYKKMLLEEQNIIITKIRDLLEMGHIKNENLQEKLDILKNKITTSGIEELEALFAKRRKLTVSA
jgi:hypothetical protein